MMHLMLAALSLVPGEGQLPTVDAEAFTKATQRQTLLATVRVVNSKNKLLGSGVLLPGAQTLAYVLTAGHVTGDADTVSIWTFAAKDYPKPARIYDEARVIARRRANNQDLALVRITGYAGGDNGLPIAPRPAADKGYTAISASCDDRGTPVLRIESIKDAVLAAKEKAPIPARFWRSQTRGKPGESGGPLINTKGQIVGIRSGAQGEHAYFCHLDDIHAFLREAGLTSLLAHDR